MRTARIGALAAAVAVVAVLVGSIPAAAATAAWAVWQPLSGEGGAFTTTVEIAARPALSASVTSDSRAGQVGVVSGASAWLSEGTSIGAKYGSSRDQPYLNLRPKADNATSPSTTTYSFSAPTPTSGWAFALGDLDADSVRIRAVAPDGHVLDAAEIGLRDLFNYCAPGLAGKPSCTGAADDVPSWDAATLTLTGNAAAADTSGAAAWFEPSTPIMSLSFIFTRRVGFPVYQTWFVSLANDIAGTVDDVNDGPLSGVPLTLTDSNGSVVGTTTTGPGGEYSFPGFVATNGYTVRVTPPTGKLSVGSTTASVDLTNDNAVNVDFTVRDIVPVSASGRVVDANGNPISGVSVTIDGQTTTTDTDGRYVFDTIPVGPHEVTIVTPTGYTLIATPAPFEVPAGTEDAIPLDDFVIAENPSLSGSVLWNGSGVPGVTITALLEGGGTVTTSTLVDGSYTFPRLPAGSYTVTMATPDGYVSTTPISRSATIAGTDITGVDFALARLGALDGTVRTDEGTPVAGAVIDVVGPAGSQQVTSAADGSYGLGGLTPGAYQLTVRPPTGSIIVGPESRTVVVTVVGEAFEGQDFTLTADSVPPPPPKSPSPSPSASTGGSGPLPGTGLGAETLGWAAGAAATLALGATLLIIGRRKPLPHTLSKQSREAQAPE